MCTHVQDQSEMWTHVQDQSEMWTHVQEHQLAVCLQPCIRFQGFMELLAPGGARKRSYTLLKGTT